MIFLDRNDGRFFGGLVRPGVTLGYVKRIAVSVQFPHARYGHAAPGLVVVVRTEKVGRPHVGMTRPIEAPCSVERKETCRGRLIRNGRFFGAFVSEIRRPHRQAVYGIGLRVLPLRESLGRKNSEHSDLQQGKK